MAFTFTNRGLYTLMTSAVSGATDLRQAVFVGAAPAEATLRDMNVLADLTAVSTEAAAAGYARADLAGVTVAEDDAGDRATLVASAPTYTAVAAGETWTHVAYYVFNAADGAAALIGVDEPAAPVVTNGGDITGPALSVVITDASV